MPIDPAHDDLSAYLDGELDPTERSDLESRLASDPALRAELEELEAAVSFLRTHGTAQAPDDFLESVLAQVADEPVPSKPWWAFLRRPFGLPVSGLAVAMAAVVVAVLAVQSGPEPQLGTTTRDKSDDVSPAVVATPDKDAKPEPVAQKKRPSVSSSSLGRGQEELQVQTLNAVWSYRILASSPAARDELVQLARSVGGDVEGPAEWGATNNLAIRIPGDRRDAFHDAMESFSGGEVMRVADDTTYTPEQLVVKVQLDLPAAQGADTKAVPPASRPTGNLDEDLSNYSGGTYRKQAAEGDATTNAYDLEAEVQQQKE